MGLTAACIDITGSSRAIDVAYLEGDTLHLRTESNLKNFLDWIGEREPDIVVVDAPSKENLGLVPQYREQYGIPDDVYENFRIFVFKRFQERLGDDAPSEEKILDGCRSLFKTLEKYRFIAERERIGVVADIGIKAGFTKEGKRDVLYALLPGLRCYRAEALSKADMLGGPVTDEDEIPEDVERISESDADNENQEGPMSPVMSGETEA